MTDEHRMNIHSACGDDVAAYALRALDPAETAAFERHLDSCAICREEFTAFEQTVNLLPTTVARYNATPTLRRRVLGAVADEPRPQPAAGSRAPGRRRTALRPATAFASLVAIAALVFAGIQLSSSPATRLIQAQVAGQGTAELKLTGGRGELILRHFSAPPAGEIYEMWLTRPRGAPSPTSPLFSVTADGSADVELLGTLRDVRTVMVTPEPAGGTPTPTRPAVLSAALT